MSSSGVSTKPASGFRDFVGQAAEQRQALREAISRVYRRFGFEELDTPALENLNVLLGSGGQENEKLIFKTLKRGEKLEAAIAAAKADELADLGLRFDLTVPLCRVYAQYRHQLSLPWKVFHIGPVWRAERPQKGRFREFTQCDVDIIGSDAVGAEFQVIEAVAEAFNGVGVNDLELHLNHREFINRFANTLGVGDRISEFAILLDKQDKLSPDKFEEELVGFLGKELPPDLKSLMNGGLSLKEAATYAPEAIQSLEELVESCQNAKLPLKKITFNPSLARGMGYYTGAVFELKHSSEGYAFGGGGRYDRLIGRFSKENVPAVGLSIGFERLLLYLESQDRQLDSNKKIFIPLFKKSLFPQLRDYAAGLRAEGFDVDIFPESLKLKAQFKYASDKSYRWVLIMGEDEIKSRNLKLKDFKTGEEHSISMTSPNQAGEIASKIRDLT